MTIDRLRRVLGRPDTSGALSPGTKAALFFAALFALTVFVVWLDPRPSLRHVKVTVLSGSPTGNYFATVDKLAAEVARRKGRVINLSSAGSVQNLNKLADAATSCEVQFALVQDGIPLPQGNELELLGRLPRPESLVLLGRNVDAVRLPEHLNGLRIGIGPVGSGTEQLMRQLLAPLSSLSLVVSTRPVDEQLGQVERGELDLAAMVIDENAKLLADAVAVRNLDILQLPEVASLARRLPFARLGVIDAGQIDYLRKLPRTDKRVLQVDTLIVGNGCASNGVTQGLLTAVAAMAPTFVRDNKDRTNLTGMPMSPVAENFFANGGPDALGRYAPWAVDIMPMPTWIQLGVAFSLLFSGMALWHRFRLWRIDADRVKIERDIAALFPAGTTVGALASMPLDPSQVTPGASAQFDVLMSRLAALSDRCRKQSLSVLVPMGAEMSYRYQEALIGDVLSSLRQCRSRLPEH